MTHNFEIPNNWMKNYRFTLHLIRKRLHIMIIICIDNVQLTKTIRTVVFLFVSVEVSFCGF